MWLKKIEWKIRLSDVAVFCSAVMRIMVRMRGSCMRIRIIRRRIRMRISVLSYACKNIVAYSETLPQKQPVGGWMSWKTNGKKYKSKTVLVGETRKILIYKQTLLWSELETCLTAWLTLKTCALPTKRREKASCVHTVSRFTTRTVKPIWLHCTKVWKTERSRLQNTTFSRYTNQRNVRYSGCHIIPTASCITQLWTFLNQFGFRCSTTTHILASRIAESTSAQRT